MHRRGSSGKMNRRRFIQIGIHMIQMAALTRLLPVSAASSAFGSESGNPMHYQPLNGRTLRGIAGEKAHHGGNGRFLNPLGDLDRKRKFGQVLRWKLFSANKFKKHLDDQPLNPVRIDWNRVKRHSGLSVTFIKHASILIRDRGRCLIVDPVFTDMFPLIKDFTPTAFDLTAMPAPDHILVTHGHYDHINEPSLAAFDPATHVVSPLGYDEVFRELVMQNRSRLDWYDTYEDGDFRITLLPCNHWTMRSPLAGPNRSLWGSFLVETPSGKTIYISGDTAYFDGFHEIGNDYDIDLAVFNLGAYEPRWFMASSHINPAETVRAFRELKAEKLMIVHWGTFQLGDEPVHFPPMDLKRELEGEGLPDRWIHIRHGETWFA